MNNDGCGIDTVNSMFWREGYIVEKRSLKVCFVYFFEGSVGPRFHPILFASSLPPVAFFEFFVLGCCHGKAALLIEVVHLDTLIQHDGASIGRSHSMFCLLSVSTHTVCGVSRWPPRHLLFQSATPVHLLPLEILNYHILPFPYPDPLYPSQDLKATTCPHTRPAVLLLPSPALRRPASSQSYTCSRLTPASSPGQPLRRPAPAPARIRFSPRPRPRPR
ncbi:hypothetical protein FPV67DRAFT_123136 [Lyophyllum atratum]|nr:hypothetical protein FPV67DRAFT_123136 [Lyophyllum atratum]